MRSRRGEGPVPTAIVGDEVREMVAEVAQLAEVLPREGYEERSDRGEEAPINTLNALYGEDAWVIGT
jgi:hypothetical protein